MVLGRATLGTAFALLDQRAVTLLALPAPLFRHHPLRQVLDHSEASTPAVEFKVEGSDLHREHVAVFLPVPPEALPVVTGILERLAQIVHVFLGPDLVRSQR